MLDCIAGAVVDDYFLGGYSSSLVKPPGKLDVISAAAAKSGDSLQAVFQIRLKGNGASFANAPTDFLMAVGPLDASGNVRKHANAQVDTLSALQHSHSVHRICECVNLLSGHGDKLD